MATTPSVQDAQKNPPKPPWITDDQYHAAIESIEEQSAEKGNDHLYEALVEVAPADAWWWAVSLAEAMLTCDLDRVDEIRRDLRKAVAEHAVTHVAKWDTQDWYQFLESIGEGEDAVCASCDGTGIGMHGDPDTSRCAECGGSGVPS